MEENFEQLGHVLQGPHRDLYRIDEIPPNFVSLVLELQGLAHRVEVGRPDMVLGRHSGADIRLAYPDISRRHCRFVFRDGCWKVLDLSSLNGVFINGDRVVEAMLYEGDQLRVGNVTFIVQGSSCVLPHPHQEVLKSIADVLPAPRQAG
jgi:pSer/pThr/pTyr-binding forkhead associated (FHA) protein